MTRKFTKMDDTDLAVRAAWLAYVAGCTQAEIAKQLGVSQAKANRLIAFAHDQKIVTVSLEGRPAACMALEEWFRDEFNLQQCVIAPVEAESSAGFDAVGMAAAQWFKRAVAEIKPKRIGVGKGRSLNAWLDCLSPSEIAVDEVISVSGSLTPRLSANPYDVVHRFIGKTGAEGYLLPVPYWVGNAQERDVFVSQPSVQAVLKQAMAADLYVVGVGALSADAHILDVGLIDEAASARLAQLGAVGDLMGRFMSVQGDILSEEDAGAYPLGVPFDALKGKRVCALAGGRHKAKAVLAALRTGMITDLVMADFTAQEIATYLKDEDKTHD